MNLLKNASELVPGDWYYSDPEWIRLPETYLATEDGAGYTVPSRTEGWNALVRVADEVLALTGDDAERASTYHEQSPALAQAWCEYQRLRVEAEQAQQAVYDASMRVHEAFTQVREDAR